MAKPHPGTPCSYVIYNGDPAGVDPQTINMCKKNAELAIDVYNKTHLNKYSFVDLVRVIGVYSGLFRMDMFFTAKEDGDDKNPVTFLANVNSTCDYVLHVDFHVNFQEAQRNLETIPEITFPIKTLYDRARPFCDGETMKIVNDCVDLALEVYNKTHFVRHYLVELVRATGHSSVSRGFMVDAMFIAKPSPRCIDDRIPKTFRTRVSHTHNYVEFLQVVPLAHPV